MHLALVTTGRLLGRLTLEEGRPAPVILRDILEAVGVREGDELGVHVEDRMVVLVSQDARERRPA